MKDRDHSLDLLRILCMLLVVFQFFSSMDTTVEGSSRQAL